MTSLNAIWRAVVTAASATLPEPEARQLANDAIARLTAETSSRPAPTVRDCLDEFTRAFTALDVNSADIHCVDMSDRIDHVIILGVTSYPRLAELAIALDLQRPNEHVEGGYSWWQAQHWPDRGISITIQAHKPRKHEAA